MVPGVFVITLPLFGDGILEIYELMNSGRRSTLDMGDAIHIVGAAPSRFQAVLLVRDIIDDIYKKTGDVDVERFLHRDQIVSGSKGMEHAYCLVDIEDTAHSYPVAGGTGSASCTSRIVCAG